MPPPDFDKILIDTAFVRRIARALVRDPDLADDLAQDALVVALERPPRAGTSLRGWIATVVRTLAIDRARKDAVRQRHEAQAARSDLAPASDEIVARLDASRNIARALRDLEEPYRTVIYLRYVEDLDPPAIAQRLDAPLATVKSQLRRGLEILRRRFDAEWGDRATWSAVLVPLTTAKQNAVIGTGVVVMSTFAKIAASLCVCAAAAWLLWPKHALEIAPASLASASDVGTELADPNHGEASRRTALELDSADIVPASSPSPIGPRAHIFGRVVDESAKGLPGVEVRASTRQGAWSNLEPLTPNGSESAGTDSLASTTDADGHFSIDAPVPTAESITISVIPGAHVRLTDIACAASFGERPEIAAGDNDLGEIVVTPSGAIAGRVLDERGSGIAGVFISCDLGEGDPSFVTTETDVDGLYVLGHLTSGALEIDVRAKDRISVLDVPVRVGLGQTTTIQDIVLLRAPTISGLVMEPDGSPAQGVTVRARGREKEMLGSGTADENGAFSMSLSSAEPVTFSIRSGGRHSGFVDARVGATEFEPGCSDVKLYVALARQVTIQVVDAANGTPIEMFGSEIRPKPEPGRSSSRREIAPLPHPQGEVVVAVPNVISVVTIDAPGYAPLECDVVSDAGTTTQTIALIRGGGLRGRVLVGDEVAAGATLNIEREAISVKDGHAIAEPGARGSHITTDVPEYAGRRRRMLTTSTGEFRFEGLAPGTYALALRGRNAAHTLLREVKVVADQVTDLGDVRLDVGGVLSGMLLCPSDETALGYTVDLKGVDVGPASRGFRQDAHIVVAHADGRFECRGLTAGTYELQWSRPGRSEWGTSWSFPAEYPRVVIEAGKITNLTLDASGASPCTVVVHVRRGGKAFAGARVAVQVHPRFESNTWSSRALGTTDANGRAEGKVEGGLRFRVCVSDAQNSPLMESKEELVATPRERIEHTLELDTGTLVLVLPPGLERPDNGQVTVSLKQGADVVRHFMLRTDSMPGLRGNVKWEGSTIELGAVMTGAYSVAIHFDRYASRPERPQDMQTIALHDPYHTTIKIEADKTTRIEVP